MTDLNALKERIEDSGMTIVAISIKSGISRQTLYHRFNGIGEFTVSEVNGLTKALNLDRESRDRIFFS